ncbi:hypothetical protein ACFL5K_04130 [Gemmatimonadota bacterium]
MKQILFEPSKEGEARLLILIAAFSAPDKSLEGRTKLAKLDFFLRYPSYFAYALRKRPRISQSAKAEANHAELEGGTIESRMMRYRFGPWDPAYFSLLGRLVGKGLVNPVKERYGIGYQATDIGLKLANRLSKTEEWQSIAERTKLLRQYFDLSGSKLKDFIYKEFPEVTGAKWGEVL